MNFDSLALNSSKKAVKQLKPLFIYSFEYREVGNSLLRIPNLTFKASKPEMSHKHAQAVKGPYESKEDKAPPIFDGGSASDFIKAERSMLSYAELKSVRGIWEGTSTDLKVRPEPKFHYQYDSSYTKGVNPQTEEGLRLAELRRQHLLDPDHHRPEVFEYENGNLSLVDETIAKREDYSPDGHQYADELLIIRNKKTYLEKVEAFDKILNEWEKSSSTKREKVEKAKGVLISCLGPSAQYVIRLDLDVNDVPGAWRRLVQHYRATTSGDTIEQLRGAFGRMGMKKWQDLPNYISDVDDIRIHLDRCHEPLYDSQLLSHLTRVLKYQCNIPDYKILAEGALIHKWDYDELVVRLFEAHARLNAEDAIEADDKARYEMFHDKKIRNPRANVAGIDPEAPQRDMSKIVCYSCERLGHIARNCKEERKEDGSAVNPKPAPRQVAPTTTTQPSNHIIPRQLPPTITVPQNANTAPRQPPQAMTAPPSANAVTMIAPQHMAWLPEVIKIDETIKIPDTSACRASVSLDKDLKHPIHIGDSGATHHMVGSNENMTDYRPISIDITQSDGITKMRAVGIGTIGYLKDCLYVPGIPHDLISIVQLTLEGRKITTGDDKMIVWEDEFFVGEPILSFEIRGDRHFHWCDPYKELAKPRRMIAASTPTAHTVRASPALEIEPAVEDEDDCNAPHEVTESTPGSTEGIIKLNRLQTWHNRLAHVTMDNLMKLKMKDSVRGLNLNLIDFKKSDLGLCDPCIKGKLAAKHIPSATHGIALKDDEVHLHIDIKPMLTQSVQGNKYITLIVEEPSGMYYAYYTKTKTGQNTILKQHYEKEIKPRSLKVRYVTTDHEAIYLDPGYTQACRDLGAEKITSLPHRHEQNGRVERGMRTLFNMIRTVMTKYNTSPGFWQYAADYSLWTLNRTRLPEGRDKTPLRDGHWEQARSNSS